MRSLASDTSEIDCAAMDLLDALKKVSRGIRG